MTIGEKIEYAEAKREEAIAEKNIYDEAYWNGYIDALKSCVLVITKKKQATEGDAQHG